MEIMEKLAEELRKMVNENKWSSTNTQYENIELYGNKKYRKE